MNRRGQGRRIAIVLALLAAPSCKCGDGDTIAPVEFEEYEQRYELGPDERYVPEWPQPETFTLDNGALVQWLTEPASSGSHVRLLVPMEPAKGDRKPPITTAQAAVIARGLELDLRRRGKSLGVRVSLRAAPGRFEISIHGGPEQVGELLTLLAVSAGNRRPARRLDSAQGKLVSSLRAPSIRTLAAAHLTSRLLERPLERDFASTQDVLEVEQPEALFPRLLDPSKSVLIVHANEGHEAFEAELAALADIWEQNTGLLGASKPRETVLGRVRQEIDRPRARGVLRGERARPLFAVPDPNASKGDRAVVMYGCLVDTPTAEDRAKARLSQRLLQEEFDARLVVFGEVSLFAVRFTLPKNDAQEKVVRELDELQEALEAEDRPERLATAAKLWLGARIVEASLDGEDWTRLWAESIDVAESDAGIGAALTAEASAMLDATPESLRKWRLANLDPRKQHGWNWVVAGASPQQLDDLAALIDLE